MKQILNSTIFQIFAVFFLSVLFMSLTVRVNGDYGIIQDGLGEPIIFIVTIFAAIAHARFLAKYDSDKTIIDHTSRAIFRFILLSFLPLIMWVQSGQLVDLLLIPLGLAAFYLFFDLFYNEFRGLPIFYIGSTAKTDILARSVFKEPVYYFLFKILMFILIVVVTLRLWV